MKQKETILTAFGQYLWDKRISNTKFAVMMTNYLNEKGLLSEGEKFSARTVEKWRYGNRIPNSINMKAIKELTGVKPDSWFQEQSEEPHAEDDRSG